MKILKLFIATAVAIYSYGDSSKAQELKIPAENTKDGKLTLINFMGDLPIEGYNGKEILITSTAEAVSVPARAKGLKPVYTAGTDNTGIGLSVEKNGNHITITCLLPLTRPGSYKIRVPENLALKYESGCERAGDINIQGIKNEIEINSCHSMTLKSVTGPLVLSTIGGNIDVIFAEPLSGKPCSISSVSGEVDVTLPSRTGADIDLQSVTGNIYSDFDFPEKNQKVKQIGGNNVNHKLNGGGFGLNLVSISGSVYLRKAN